MTVNGGHPTGLFFIYGWRGDRGPYYVGGASSALAAIERARAERRRWKRVQAKNVRTGEVVADFGMRTA